MVISLPPLFYAEYIRVFVRGCPVYPEDYKVVHEEKEISLTLKEFEILHLLVQNKKRTLSHETIMARVYGYDFDRLENTVQAHIKNLRAKLPVDIIKTVRGVGYRLEDS